MALKLSQKNSGSSIIGVKLMSIIFLSISLFFGVLFYTSWSMVNAMNELGAVNSDGPIIIYLMAMSALTVCLIAIEFYYIGHTALSAFKYFVILGNAALIGLIIHELTNGYTALFSIAGTDEADAIQYSYASLATGFAGVGTLLAILHNFHGIITYA